MTDEIQMSQWPSDHRYVIPVAPGPDLVTITIDGKEVQVARGELLIKAAQQHGTYIPRFCWHERMKPVGMCRMCLVEVEGMRGLVISCATPVADGMVVHTTNDRVKGAQDGVLEFLLINHPLDCPVCDRGGECPLQDQTLAFGPGESRFIEEKRHFEKPIPISDLVLLDRERCIQCGRCTRFAAEVAGDPLIDFGGRGGTTEVITYPDEPFTSYFSGNTVQICPVGALTAGSYRFRARPWDLQTVETSCTTCAVNCRGALQSTSNQVVRLLGVDSEPVNQGWLCDKGRYGIDWVHRDDRVRTPMVKQGGELVNGSWPDALDAAAASLQQSLDTHGPGSIAMIGGARGTNEDAYVWGRLLKGVLGTDHVDAQLGDGLPAEVVLGLPRAVISDLDRARGIVLLGPDLKEELPVLALRVRLAAVELGVPLIEIAAGATGLTRDAHAVLRHAPGDEGSIAQSLARALSGNGTASGDGQIERAVDALDGRDGDLVVVLGRPSLAESPAAVVQAAAALAGVPGVKFLSALRRGNVHGALDLGLTPGFLPGRVTLDAGRDALAAEWGSVPAAGGLDTIGILEAAANGQIDTLVVLGADLERDVPDADLVARALAGVRSIIAVGAFADDAAARADVFLPTTVWGEKTGTTTNLEGRVQRVTSLVSPDGTSMDDWRIAGELAVRFGTDFGFETVDDVQNEIARVAPAFAGVDAGLVRRARDGAVLPIAAHPEEIVLHAALGVSTGVSWEPIKPGIAFDDTHLSSIGGGAVASSGTGSLSTIKPGLTEGDDADEGEAVPALVDAASDSLAGAPALHEWDRVAPVVALDPTDAYSLRLVVARRLHDAGATAASSSAVRGLADDPALFVHPSDLSRLGVNAVGDDVRVTSARATITLPVRTDPSVAPGTAFIPFAQGGEANPAVLIDANVAVTDVRVETTR
ncbi:MAG: NADH-quinone oxidoreductase subunit NuoG [Acidimicrobiia bacterium]